MSERFTLLTELGRGGMGVVWKARDEETGSIVALKLLRETYAEDPDYVTRFERELELAKRIQSPNVVKVLGYGVRDGTPYLALEYVDGPSLRERLAVHDRYDWSEAKPLLAQIAQGLADAHAAGVIHRDLKPSNVLIGSDGVAKLADFGIAKGLDLTRVTGTSTLLGTPAYLAPEGPADERSDLYSLGVIAYEILTGVVPFEGRTYQEVILHHIKEAPDLEKLPKDSRKIIGRLLAKNPVKRPQNATDLIGALEGQHPGLTPVASVSKRIAASANASTTELPAAAALLVGPAPVATTAAPPVFPPVAQRPERQGSRRQLALLAVIGLLIVLVVAASAVLAAGHPFVAAASSTPTQSQTTAQLLTPSQATFARGQSSFRAPVAASAAASATASVTAWATSSGALAISTPQATVQPTLQPTRQPAVQPTLQPTPQPTVQPTPTATQGGAYITGVVTASEGGPLAGIDVIVDDCGFGTCGLEWDARSQSDGSYAVGPLPPGKYEVTWEDPAGRRAPVRLTAGGASAFPSDNYHVDVGGSSMSGISAAMPLGGRVTGTLTPAPGKSLPAQVNIIPFLVSSGSGWWPWEGEMNADGTYSTGVLPAGTYDLEIDNGSTWVYWSSSGLTTGGTPTPITISSSDVGSINGQLPW
jgi:serine/threonine-protein kinase